MTSNDHLRAEMVARDIAGRDVRDERVLDAMRAVPREVFVPEAWRTHAFDDRPLPIEADQTISQPYIVALMAEALQLRGDEHVLEVGAGSGYAAAVLARLAARVDAVECVPLLAEGAARRLADLGVKNVQLHCADGSLGWPAGAPFDAISVAAGGPRVPSALREQLAVGGRLVMPVGAGRHGQDLVRVTRTREQGFRTETLGQVSFVPLTGAQGWPAA
jgi:protein-L-isoaspartate(D-aspartate) O-methyltransferase